MESRKPEMNLKSLEVSLFTYEQLDKQADETGELLEEMVNQGMFPRHICQPQALIDGEPLQNGTIFISTEVKVKSTGKLKFMTFFHIKKSEEFNKV